MAGDWGSAPPGAVPQSLALIEADVAFEQGYPACGAEIMELPFSEGLDPPRRGDVDVLGSRMPIVPPDLIMGPCLPPEPRLLAFAGQFAHPSIATVQIIDLPSWESGLARRRDSRGSRLHTFAQVVKEVLQTQSRVVTR